MARIIPSENAREHDPRSREGAIYESLKTLPDEYVVVHSMTLVSVADQSLRENEADFVLFHRDKGLICFEAKAGKVSYSDGEWRYSDGRPMKHGGPFNQAQNGKFHLMDAIRERGLRELVKSCRLYHAVWFPSLSSRDIDSIFLPEECDRRLLLSKDDLMDPQPAVERIFELNHHRPQNVTEADERKLIERVLCPAFDLVPTARTRYDFNDITFARLLESQTHVLDFLSEQRFAVINGVAGSGKTLIAITYAKKMASRQEKTLFLCFNALLAQDVKRRCDGVENLDVYTIDAFTMKLCGSIDYCRLEELLFEDPGSFPYLHLVVDEGQDFSSEAEGGLPGKVVDRSDILDALKMLIEEREGGTFFLFYDKHQLIQGTGLPDFINDADCKISLWVNCRNTANIAKCSAKALDDNLDVMVRDNAPAGSVPKLYHSTSVDRQIDLVDKCITELQQSGLKDIVILTCKTEEKSILSNALGGEKANRNWKGSHIPFISCRRFKGLEADAVILTDVTSDLWAEFEDDAYGAKPGLLFYTAASRAKHELRIVCDMDEDDFQEAAEIMNIPSRRNALKSFARRINALPVR